MAKRILTVVVLVPLAIILIALAVANRAPTAFTFDPFNPGNPALTVSLPLFALLFLALIIGMFIGSMATWFRQGRYRRIARPAQCRGGEAEKADPACRAEGRHQGRAGASRGLTAACPSILPFWRCNDLPARLCCAGSLGCGRWEWTLSPDLTGAKLEAQSEKCRRKTQA